MAVQDFTHNEVRLRNRNEFTQSPNFVVAAETLADGVFVHLTGDGYRLASEDTRATHLVVKSGVARVTVAEISDYTGTVQLGEPVMAVTGLGRATIPFAEDVQEGQALAVNANGYAVPWDGDAGDTGAFVVGRALETVNANGWGDAFINLPAQYSPLTTSETE